MSRAIAALLWAACIAGCDQASDQPDAGHDSPDARADTGAGDAGSPDSGAGDAGPDEVPPLFGRCETDADCQGESATCLTGYPGGLCTIPCTTAEDCGANAVCAHDYCRPACTSGGRECDAWQSMCDATSEDTWCRYTCYEPERAPAGALLCNEGLVCDPQRNGCRDPADIPTTGGDIGDPCTVRDDCRSAACVPEVGDGPTGYVGGACVGFGTMPPEDELVEGGPLPRSTCPEGSVIDIWVSATVFGSHSGDMAVCAPACMTSADCRAGYACMRGGTPEMPQFSVGACEPLVCNDGPGTDCPAGYICNVSHACVPPA